jgi:hypothetical protein
MVGRFQPDHLIGNRHLDPEFPRLIVGARHQRHASDAGGKAEIVLDASGGAGLAAERTAIENQRGETFGTCIDRSSKACRSGAHNGHVVDPVRIDRWRR